MSKKPAVPHADDGLPWKLRLHERSRYYRVRFSHAGVRYEESTGKSDIGEAQAHAAQLYQRVVSGQHRPPVRLIINSETRLDELGAEWLADIESGGSNWLMYLGYWCKYFVTLGAFCAEGAVAKYWVHRLQSVLSRTVGKETGGMKDFAEWLVEQGHVSTLVDVPKLPSTKRGKNKGVRYHKRRRGNATKVSGEQARAIIAALPPWSTRKPAFPVHARYVVAFETGLRPKMLANIRAPEHYFKGSEVLQITGDIDKVDFGRDIPLSAAARAALDSVCPEEGLIFGRHNFRNILAAAVKAAKLPEHLAKTFATYDFKHRAATEMASTGDLAGTAYLMGWKHVTTANNYVHPDAEAAEEVLAARQALVEARAQRKAAKALAASNVVAKSATAAAGERTVSETPALAATPKTLALPSGEPAADPPGVLAWGTELPEEGFRGPPEPAFSNQFNIVRGRGLEPPRPFEHQNLKPSQDDFPNHFHASQRLQTLPNTPGDPSAGVLPQAALSPSDLLSAAISILSANALGEQISSDQSQALARAALSGTEIGRLALEVLDGGPRATAAAIQLAAVLSTSLVSGAESKSGRAQ